NLIIEGLVPSQTTCKSGSCSGMTLANPVELQGKGSYEFSFFVQVNENATGSSITHPGQSIVYQGENEQIFEATSNSLTHTLIASPEPTGDFQHDITLNRRIVLNSKDGSPRGDFGDSATVKYEFSYTGDPLRIPVYPYLTNGNPPHQNNTVNFCAGYVHT